MISHLYCYLPPRLFHHSASQLQLVSLLLEILRQVSINSSCLLKDFVFASYISSLTRGSKISSTLLVTRNSSHLLSLEDIPAPSNG